MAVRRSQRSQDCVVIFYLFLLCKACSGLHTAPCDYHGSLLLAVGDVAVKQMEMTYSDSKQKYVETAVMYFTRPQSEAMRMVAAVKDTYMPWKNEQYLCLRSFDNFDPCCSANSEECDGRRHPTRQCMKSPVGDAHSTQYVQYVQSLGGNGAAGCPYVGNVEKWNLTAVDNNTVLHTWVTDRETKPCDGPARRLFRREVITYRVVQGCLLGARAQDCEPGVATCKPCAKGNVALNKTIPVLGGPYKPITYCRPRTATCALSKRTFIGCPAGTQAEGYNATARTVKCSLCGQHTINDENPDGWPGSGLRVQCRACSAYSEAPGLGNTECRECKAGQYASSKTAPINCKDCPPETFTDFPGRNVCTKCPQFFFQDKAGQKSCKRCPTEWRCLVPANLLDKWQYTPFRWDASGHPQCVTLDGKECWKDTAIPCSKKLQMLADLMEQGKFKPLTCGEQHKKVWGHTGYEDGDHWCPITKRLFMIAGKPNIGATSCGAAVTNMTLPRPVP